MEEYKVKWSSNNYRNYIVVFDSKRIRYINTKEYGFSTPVTFYLDMRRNRLLETINPKLRKILEAIMIARKI